MARASWRQKNLVAIIFGFFLALMSVMALELVCYHLNRSSFSGWLKARSPYPYPSAGRQSQGGPHGHSTSFRRLKVDGWPRIHHQGPSGQLDRTGEIIQELWLDYIHLKKNVNHRSVVKVASTGEVVFDATYSTDDYGRRITPGQDGRKRPKHFLIMGCSFAFGVGLNQEETLAAQIAQEAPSYRVYNLALPGSSPSHFLDLAAKDGFWDGIKEPQGSAAFIFMDDHINRVLGTMSVAGNWGQNMPYVAENENGILEVQGTFQSNRAFITNLYTWIWRSEIVKAFGINLPWQTTQKDFDFIARILGQIKASYQKRFPGQNFFVVGYPGGHSSAMPYLRSSLETHGIDYLDYSDFMLELYSEKPMTIKYDGHPTADAIKLWAPVLAEDLGLKDGKAK